MKIPLSSIDLTEREVKYVQDALATRWISGTGHYVSKFEESIAQTIERKFTVAVANGTLALELALRVLDIGPGDEVIVPAFTFVAPAAAVRTVGALPIFADIDEETWTLNPNEVKKQITNKTKAIIAVDILGHPCDYDSLLHFDIPLIEDAAEAHGAQYRSKPVGSFGLLSTFSFHANKTVTTGEGGAIATNDDSLHEKMRLLANHGMTRERPYWHPVIGHNYRMTNLVAAIGLGQVERWEALVEARNRVAQHYNECLAGTGITPRPIAAWASEACWLYTLATSKRAQILNTLREAEIDARPIWPALPDLPIYQESCRGTYPVARRISATSLWLPTWSNMPFNLIEYISSLIRNGLGVDENNQTGDNNGLD